MSDRYVYLQGGSTPRSAEPSCLDAVAHERCWGPDHGCEDRITAERSTRNAAAHMLTMRKRILARQRYRR